MNFLSRGKAIKRFKMAFHLIMNFNFLSKTISDYSHKIFITATMEW